MPITDQAFLWRFRNTTNAQVYGVNSSNNRYKNFLNNLKKEWIVHSVLTIQEIKAKRKEERTTEEQQKFNLFYSVIDEVMDSIWEVTT